MAWLQPDSGPLGDQLTALAGWQLETAITSRCQVDHLPTLLGDYMQCAGTGAMHA